METTATAGNGDDGCGNGGRSVPEESKDAVTIPPEATAPDGDEKEDAPDEDDDDRPPPPGR